MLSRTVPVFFSEMPVELEMVKSYRGILGSKNFNIQMIAHSKELDKLRQMTSKSARSNDFEQNYEQLNYRLNNCFCYSTEDRSAFKAENQ